MGYVFLVLGILLAGCGTFLGVKTARTFVINKEAKEFPKKNFLTLLGALGGIAVGGAFLLLAIKELKHWNMQVHEVIFGLLGTALFLYSFIGLWFAFYFYFWKKDQIPAQRKFARIAMFAAIPVALVGFLVAGEAIANHLTYPLISGFGIDNNGFYWVRYGVTRGGFSIRWYALCIIFGAVVCLWMGDHRFYKKYGRHGIMDNCLLLVLPAGIIGARLWYVIGNWYGDGAGGPNFSEYVARGEWYRIFEIWNGGIIILGGAVAGIIAGAAFVMTRRKYVDIRWASDAVVPSILIAQAIGRWGNFFNHEVYGAATPMSGWPLLPTWIKFQMGTTFEAGSAVGGNMYVPLFLIEGIFNLAGYFIIAYLIKFLWKSKIEKNSTKWYHRSLGDLAALYMVWYGIVRMIMEPLRDPSFNMGSNGMWSFWNSMVYIIIGVAFIIFFHLLDHHLIKKGKPLEKPIQERKEKQTTPKTPKTPQIDLDSAPKPIEMEDEKKE